MQLLKQSPKPSGCPLLMAKVTAAVAALLLLTWLVIS